jgi:hypothetical protein
MGIIKLDYCRVNSEMLAFIQHELFMFTQQMSSENRFMSSTILGTWNTQCIKQIKKNPCFGETHVPWSMYVYVHVYICIVLTELLLKSE